MATSLRTPCLAALLAVAPARLMAQSAPPADTLPFRRGQWGGEASVGYGSSVLGLLRFSSPSAAWVLNVGFNGAHGQRREEPDTGGVRKSTTQGLGANARIGRRRYRPLGDRTVAFSTLGVSGGGSATRRREPGWPAYYDYASWSAGAYGEVGGAWMVTRNFSLGLDYSAGVSYNHSWQQGTYGKVTDRGMNAGVGVGQLTATLYF